VHNTFCIPATCKHFTPMYPGSPTFDRLAQSSVCLIDEFSMIDARTLNLVVFRLRDVYRNNDPFQKVLVVIFGDHAQLPVVCYHQMPEGQVCLQCHISRSLHWRVSESIYPLTISMRHEDEPFLQFSQLIRHSVSTQEQIDACLGRCYVSES
jgi:hypothetical protein